MRFRTVLAAGAAVLAVCAAAASASAGIVNSAPGSTFVPFPVVNVFGPGPETFGPGITWSSTNAGNQGGSVFGYNGGYGFGSNGSTFDTMAGLNDSNSYYGVVDTMTFAFSTPVKQVGGVLNWSPDGGDNVHVDWYDSSNNLLGDLVLNNSGGDVSAPDQYYGFKSSTANIAYFTLTDGYVGVLDGLSINGGVPEPATWAMMLLGVGAIGAAQRMARRKAQLGLAAA